MGDLLRHRMVAKAFGARHDGGDAPVQWELDQDAARRRHGLGDGVEEAAWAPMQQHAKHQEQQVVGVEVGNRQDRVLGCELLHDPAAVERNDDQGQQRAVFEPLAGAFACGKLGHLRLFEGLHPSSARSTPLHPMALTDAPLLSKWDENKRNDQ